MKTTALIESLYPTLTKTEKQIADYLLNGGKSTITSMSLSELSSALGFGEATIIRFCRKLNYKGFQDMKFSLALDEAKAEDEHIAENYMDAIENNMISTVHNTRAVVDNDELAKAIQLLSQTDHLYIYGAGSSAFVAEIGEERLMRIGKRSKAIKESHLQCAQASICNQKDVLIVISISGSTIDLYEAVKIAKDNGARLIVLTNHMNSPMAKLADCILLTCGKESPITGGSMATMVSQMYVMDLICGGYAIQHPEETQIYKEKVARSINKKLAAL